MSGCCASVRPVAIRRKRCLEGSGESDVRDVSSVVRSSGPLRRRVRRAGRVWGSFSLKRNTLKTPVALKCSTRQRERILCIQWTELSGKRCPNCATAFVAFLLLHTAAAQYPPPNAPPGGTEPGTPISPQQLDDLVAPIALYPDPVVGEVLAAATYPMEIAEYRFLGTRRKLNNG
jgi:hypothetical protein